MSEETKTVHPESTWQCPRCHHENHFKNRQDNPDTAQESVCHDDKTHEEDQ